MRVRYGVHNLTTYRQAAPHAGGLARPMLITLVLHPQLRLHFRYRVPSASLPTHNRPCCSLHRPPVAAARYWPRRSFHAGSPPPVNTHFSRHMAETVTVPSPSLVLRSPDSAPMLLATGKKTTSLAANRDASKVSQTNGIAKRKQSKSRNGKLAAISWPCARLTYSHRLYHLQGKAFEMRRDETDLPAVR